MFLYKFVIVLEGHHNCGLDVIRCYTLDPWALVEVEDPNILFELQ